MASPSVTYTFSNGTTADATQVNQNFTDIINGITDGSKDLSISALTCAGAVALNGNTTLGNATSDTITFTGRVASTTNPSADITYDLGSSGLAWRALYADDVFLSLGAVGSPSHSFVGDTDTGMWSSAANKVNFSAGGVEVLELGTTSTETVFNDGGVDIDFRVEGDNEQKLLFCDAGNDRVGIGDDPDTRFHVANTAGACEVKIETDAANAPTLSFYQAANKRGSLYANSGGMVLDHGLIINESGNDIDVRIESNVTEYAFFMQGSDGAVGFNSSTPSSNLPDSFAQGPDSGQYAGVVKIQSEGTTTDACLMLRRSDDATGLDLWQDSGTGNSYIDNLFNASLIFRSNTASTPADRVWINGTGLGVGVAPSTLLHVSNGGTNTFRLGGTAGDTSNIELYQGTTNRGNIFPNAYGVNVQNLVIPTLTGTDPLATDANGTVTAGSSDERLKKNIGAYELGLQTVLALNPVKFQWKESQKKEDTWDIGFIAQEVEKLVPEAVGVAKQYDLDDCRTFNPAKLLGSIVNAIKDLKLEIDELRNKLS